MTSDKNGQLSYPQALAIGDSMDKIKAFIETMTVWNWLALVAFLIAIFSGLNAFLSLKSRYKDWRGTKSKLQFEDRLRELEKQLTRIEKFKSNPNELYNYVITTALRFMSLFFMACFAFVSAFTFSILPPQHLKFRYQLFAVVMSIISSITVYLCALIASNLRRVVRRAQDPKIFAMEVLSFIGEGERKGFKVDKDSRLYKFAETTDFGRLFSGQPVP
jgi:Na+/melibiose symporter-like transporter